MFRSNIVVEPELTIDPEVISLNSFNIGKAKALLINNDTESDDVFFLLAALRKLYEIHGNNMPPICISSGGGNSAIQNERAKKYIELLKKEGGLPEDASIEFIRGCPSDKQYPRQGEDVLTLEEIKLIPAEQKPESEKLKAFIAKHPDLYVVNIKRPNELLDKEILPLLSQATLITYTGGFNYRAETKDIDPKLAPEVQAEIKAQNDVITNKHQEQIKELFQSFKRVGIVQNFHVLQNGNLKDATPRDIMSSNTPELAAALKKSMAPTALAQKKLIRIWNEKTLLDISSKIKNFDAKLSNEHAAGIEELKVIFKEGAKTILDDETLKKLAVAVNKLSGDDKAIGFRKKMWLNVINDIAIQTVLADQLILLSFTPEVFSNKGVVGSPEFKDGFLVVNENLKGNCLNFPAVKGLEGKPVPGSRISLVDHLLTEAFLGKANIKTPTVSSDSPMFAKPLAAVQALIQEVESLPGLRSKA